MATEPTVDETEIIRGALCSRLRISPDASWHDILTKVDLVLRTSEGLKKDAERFRKRLERITGTAEIATDCASCGRLINAGEVCDCVS